MVNVGTGVCVLSVDVVLLTLYCPLGYIGSRNTAATEPPAGTDPVATVVVVNPMENATV